jgi:8-oxo-dGTP diphosphatase
VAAIIPSVGPGIRVRVAVCVTAEDQMLLVEHEKAGRRYWLLPGGGLEKGETMLEACRRELREETGYDAEIGRLLIVCEAIQPGGRHIVNMVFAGRLLGGSLSVGVDAALRDARWHSREALGDLVMFPPVTESIVACWDEAFQGPVRVLGNVWRDAGAR